MEQTLGHVTQTLNLKRFLAAQAGVEAHWFEVPFRPDELLFHLPPVSLNWSLRGSLYVRQLLCNSDLESLDALFVHTLTIGLLATDVYRRVPAIISMDATPMNFDLLAEPYGHRRLPPPVERLKQRFARRAFEEADSLVATSEWTKQSLVDDYDVAPERVTVVAPGIDLELFSACESRRNERVRILFVGADFRRKGGDVLLNIFRRRLRPRAELHIVTNADLTPEDDIFVYRSLTPNCESLLDLYRTADIFALPTAGDCLAVALCEAMASSLPVVTTSVGAHAEVVQQGVNGFIVDDSDSLGDALEQLVEDERLRRQMGAAARSLAAERFDASKNATTLLDLLRRAAGGTSVRSPEALVAANGERS
jgi:glycosyltransferase involved in cell wall biosynthesis